MLHNFSDQTIVIKRVNFGDADRILTLFTKYHGKISAIAKGIRKTTSRKAPHLELLTFANLYFATSHHLPIITQAETVNNYDLHKKDLNSSKLIFHLLEVLDQLLAENEIQTDLFTQLIKFLSSDIDEKSLTEFEVYLLDHLGFGLPKTINFVTINAYIESIIDRQLNSLRKLK
jgi:DNA repair protein RecO (recombination protein O)